MILAVAMSPMMNGAMRVPVGKIRFHPAGGTTTYDSAILIRDREDDVFAVEQAGRRSFAGDEPRKENRLNSHATTWNLV